jgi:Hemerythrin HHE cation binding domain
VTGLPTVAAVAGAAVSLAVSWLLVSRLERVGGRLVLSKAPLGLVAALAADAPEVTAAITAIAGYQRIGAGVVIGSNAFNLAALLSLGARTWGGGLVAFVDGMRFVVPVPPIYVRPNRFPGNGHHSRLSTHRCRTRVSGSGSPHSSRGVVWARAGRVATDRQATCAAAGSQKARSPPLTSNDSPRRPEPDSQSWTAARGQTPGRRTPATSSACIRRPGREPAMARPTQQHLSPSDHGGIVLTPGTGRPGDVIDLIMADHRRIRRLSATLDDAVRHAGHDRSDWVAAQVWQRLAGLLEAHAGAEEEICYLAMFGSGPQATQRMQAAIADHDEIREAISEAGLQRPGSATWWRTARFVLVATAEHLGREERGVLASCLPRLSVSRRRELGRQWATFIAAWTQDAESQARSHLAPQPDAEGQRPAVGVAPTSRSICSSDLPLVSETLHQTNPIAARPRTA